MFKEWGLVMGGQFIRKYNHLLMLLIIIQLECAQQKDLKSGKGFKVKWLRMNLIRIMNKPPVIYIISMVVMRSNHLSGSLGMLICIISEFMDRILIRELILSIGLIRIKSIKILMFRQKLSFKCAVNRFMNPFIRIQLEILLII